MASRVRGPDVESEAKEDVPNKSACLKNTSVNEKQKTTTNRKDWKPPRPPNSPSLDAADLRMMRRILTEIARKKRAKIERIKTIKKLRTASQVPSMSSTYSSSSKSGDISIPTMILTFLFFLTIINFSV
ncbi:hypothetical protein FNV43_RR13756 [Rhamnella rubrinervis]|uniref:Uncharacterized protein n=1 Tax=Rhamnella rubrinervis TaxID=2594499 RepID=A0A8K0MFJ1_9ROSA|nr:hypothetical protein FNV43_RR13756 [Rhamnella rubrinervis]